MLGNRSSDIENLKIITNRMYEMLNNIITDHACKDNIFINTWLTKRIRLNSLQLSIKSNKYLKSIK